MTVEHDQRYVHFASTNHRFSPIAVGRSHPPTQVSILEPNPAASIGKELILLYPKDRKCQAILRKWNSLHREASQENFKDSSRQSLEMAAGTAAGEVLLTVSSLIRFGVH